MIADAVEDHIVTFGALREILLRVVDHAVRADGVDHLDIPGTAYAGHIRAKRLGDLHRECSYASGRTVDQNLLPRPKLAMIAKALQSGESRYGNGGRLLKRYVGGLHSQFRFGSTRVLGKGSSAYA